MPITFNAPLAELTQNPYNLSGFDPNSLGSKLGFRCFMIGSDNHILKFRCHILKLGGRILKLGGHILNLVGHILNLGCAKCKDSC